MLRLFLCLVFGGGWVILAEPVSDPVRAKAEQNADEAMSNIAENDEAHTQNILNDIVKLLNLDVQQRETLMIAATKSGVARAKVFRDSIIPLLLEYDYETYVWWYKWFAVIKTEPWVLRFKASDEAWDRALEATLSPAQQQRWRDEIKKREAIELKLTLKFAERMVGTTIAEFHNTYEQRCQQLSTLLKFDKAQEEALRGWLADIEQQTAVQLQANIEADAKGLSRGFMDILDSRDRRMLANGNTNNFYPAYATAEQQMNERWKQHLEQWLTPAQNDVLKAHLIEVNEQLDKAYFTQAEQAKTEYRAQRLTMLQSMLDELVVALGIGAEHAKEMQSDLERAFDKTMVTWSKDVQAHTRKCFESIQTWSVDERLQHLVVENYRFDHRDTNDAQGKREHEAWQELLDSHLSSDEQHRWTAAEAMRFDKRAQAWTLAVGVATDSVANLTAEQRNRLMSVVGHIIRPFAAIREPVEQVIGNGNLSGFLVFLHGLASEELASCLDADQQQALVKVLASNKAQWNFMQRKVSP